LSEAFREHDEKFPSIFFSILEAGEMSGTLDDSFERLGASFEKDYKLQNKIKNALTYPIVVGIVATAVVIYLLAEVVPTFVGVFESTGSQLPAVTELLISISDFVRNNYIILAGVILLIVVAIRVILKTHSGRFEWDKTKLKLPVFGKLIKKIVAARFTRTLCTLFSSGVSLTASLEVSSRSLNNLFVEEGILEVTENVKQGRALADTLEELDVFPAMVYHMTRVGEESGTLETMLERTSDYYTDEANDAITRMMSMLEPLIIVVLGGIVLFIVISILLPMFQMINIM
jgi:type IV pilus assembly protein PilC